MFHFTFIDEALGLDNRIAIEAVGLGVDDQHDRDNAFFCQPQTVIEDILVHITHARSVDQDTRPLGVAGKVGQTLRAEFQDIPVLEEDDLVIGDAHHTGQFSVPVEHAEFAV